MMNVPTDRNNQDSRLEAFGDQHERGWARIRLAGGDACWIGFDTRGLQVRKGRFHTLFAPTLFRDKSVEHVLGLAVLLGRSYDTHPELPDDMTNPILRAFTNVLLHCRTADEVSYALRGTMGRN